jgi:hypothetical protein
MGKMKRKTQYFKIICVGVKFHWLFIVKLKVGGVKEKYVVNIQECETGGGLRG